MFQAKNLTKRYGSRPVVIDISLQVNRGEIVGLLGPNGAGKTTTFYMLIGVIKCDSGAVLLDGEDITGYPMYLRARKGIGYLPQEPSIFRKLTVRENIKAVLEFTEVDKEGLDKRVNEIIEEFKLKEFSEREGYRLSGGERRRTEIARMLSLSPSYVLFDEPFAGIDPITITELKKMINYIREKNVGIIITDHNVRDTLSITDRAYIINDGRILAHGTPEELIKNESVKKIYLGEEFNL
ncbi:MAG: LPS export ABC transporter ATP-binding protein [Thermodesulfovibrionales bacterium]|nr:LPS export ABC transporter ATP-binding protein [Thermodesulfovibrionales bacterium]